MSEFYDWPQTFSYDADVTMVIGARGLGKTFGLRAQFVRDWKKDGSRFVEICRFKNELSDVADGYFQRVGELPEFKDLEFKTDARCAYVCYRGDTNQRGKPDWKVIGYFVAMSESQKKKKKTFDKVRRIVLDEAILDRNDRYHTYMRNEWELLAGIVDTTSREREDTDCVRPRVYLLGNACNIANPYFAHFHVSADIKFGYRWYGNKTFLLHYVDSADYSREKATGTVAGRMLAGTSEGNVNISNEFVTVGTEFVARKPSRARFMFALVLNGRKYAIWVDDTEGLYYVCNKVPRNTQQPIYTLTRADSTVNYIAARRADRVLQTFVNMWYMGLMRYESVEVKTGFESVLELFGIR